MEDKREDIFCPEEERGSGDQSEFNRVPDLFLGDQPLTQEEREKEIIERYDEVAEHYRLRPAEEVLDFGPFLYEYHAECRKCRWSEIIPVRRVLGLGLCPNCSGGDGGDLNQGHEEIF